MTDLGYTLIFSGNERSTVTVPSGDGSLFVCHEALHRGNCVGDKSLQNWGMATQSMYGNCCLIACQLP